MADPKRLHMRLALLALFLLAGSAYAAVARVDLSVNGTVIATTNVAPYVFSWDTTKMANGTSILTATAYDDAGNFTVSAPVTVYVLNPTIASVLASARRWSATITWTTGESASSVVQYGTSAANLANTTAVPGSVTAHSVTLTGLKNHTTYYYQVTSRDAAGNQNTSAVGSFTTR